MAVIITEMDIPDRCVDCYCSAGYGCEIAGAIMTTDAMKSRPDWCPLKSVDGLIEELEIERDREIGGNDPKGIWEYKNAMGEAVEIVKRYCEVD